MDNKYLCLFDSDGRRGETHLACEFSESEKQKMLEAGFVEITEEEWNFYVGNKGMGDNGTGYIRDSKTGKPVSAPAYIPSKAEKIVRLEAQYNTQKEEVKGYLLEAILSGDTDTISELKQEMAEIEADYLEKREDLEG